MRAVSARRGLTALAAAGTLLLATSAAARADDYCVDLASASGCDHVENPGGTAGLSAAFTAANASTGVADTIRVGAGTYTGQFAGVAGAGALTFVGAGSSGDAVTTLTVTGDAHTVLALGASGSSAAHVHLQLPDNSHDTALALNGSASDVLIDDPDGSTQATGVEMDHPDSFSGTIHLANGDTSTGIERTANGTGAEAVSDSAIFATQGFDATSGTWTIDHDRVIALNRGIQALDGTTFRAVVSVADSLVRVTTTDTATCGAVVCFGLGVSGDSTITGRRLTLAGPDQAIPGGYALGAISGKTATLDLGSTVISGFDPALTCSQSAGGTATVRADYSDFALPVVTAGGCVAPATGHNLWPFAPPNLVTGGFDPMWDSPLIDAGDPAALLAPGATDLDGLARLVDGRAGGTPAAVVDIGAFEYQRRPPSVTGVTVAVAPAGVGVPFAVGKASDPDPGDTLTFSWTFDDGATVPGPQVTHPFATPGVHTGTVTATDPTGLTATSTASVDVVARKTPPDTTAPRITSLRVTPSKLRATTRKARLAKRAPAAAKIAFKLSEAATLELTFAKKTTGHRVHGKCRAHGRGHSCTLYTKIRDALNLTRARAGNDAIHFYGRVGAHKLPAATYRITMRATDAAGNRSKSAQATFSIIKRR